MCQIHNCLIYYKILFNEGLLITMRLQKSAQAVFRFVYKKAIRQQKTPDDVRITRMT